MEPALPEDGAVRQGNLADLERVAEIEAQSAEAARWNARDYLEHDFRVIEREGSVAGFAVVREVAGGECELLNLAVAPETRRLGLGKLLLDDMARRHAGAVYLEVRASNTNARSFYKSFGFEEVGARAGYYQDPPERAVVMMFRSC